MERIGGENTFFLILVKCVHLSRTLTVSKNSWKTLWWFLSVKMLAVHLISFFFSKLQEDPTKKVSATHTNTSLFQTVHIINTALVMRGFEALQLKSSQLWKCKLLMHWIYALDWKSYFKCNSTRYINHQRYICHQWQTYSSNVLFPDLLPRQFYQDLSRKRKWLKEGQISDDFFEDLQKCTWLKLSQRDMAEVRVI